MIEPDPPPSTASGPRSTDRARTVCPSDAHLSLFIDGGLDAADRAQLVGHLEACDDCREVVATVVQAHEQLGQAASAPLSEVAPLAHPVRPQWRSPWLWAAAAAAVAVVAVRLIVPGTLPESSVAPESAIEALARARGSERALEARLSLLPEHVPLAAPTRAAGSAAADFTARAVDAKLGESFDLTAPDASDRVRAQHVAAVAALLAGRTNEAAAGLQATLMATDDRQGQSRVLTDLSAVQAARGDWTAALDAGRDAVARDSANLAGRFNVALALERLGRRDEATRAWTDIANDPSELAGWRDEARQHLRALRP